MGQQHLRGESKSSGQQVPEGNSANDPSQVAESSLFNPLLILPEGESLRALAREQNPARTVILFFTVFIFIVIVYLW